MMFNTLMEKEAAQTPNVIEKQIIANQPLVEKIGHKLRDMAPKVVMMIGRGSSDHAGVFGKYLIEIEAGVPVSSAAPSVASVYSKTLKLEGAVVIVISQSGRSPDILAQAKMAKEAGAYCIALVNDEASPLQDIVDDFVPLKAGDEISVAATKSYLATLSALVHIVANWTQNESLLQGLKELPSALDAMIDSPTQLQPTEFANIKNMVVLARGLGFSISKEMALKLKEVCAIHAESFSSAEFLHGPVTLVEQGLVILDCSVDDETKESHQQQIAEVKKRGAHVISLNQNGINVHPRLAPFLVLQRFYLDVAKVALSRGFNPDEPKGLKKVTRTL